MAEQDLRSLVEAFAGWPLGQDALMDAVECVILANWQPGLTASDLGPDVGELWRVYSELTGWQPTEQAKADAAG